MLTFHTSLKNRKFQLFIPVSRIEISTFSSNRYERKSKISNLHSCLKNRKFQLFLRALEIENFDSSLGPYKNRKFRLFTQTFKNRKFTLHSRPKNRKFQLFNRPLKIVISTFSSNRTGKIEYFNFSKRP